jgi:endonuclease/exonuclease/phosphatase family metal-dependent hydrolase
MKLTSFLTALIGLWAMFSYGQQKKHYVVRTIAFYNVENLFDTINEPKTFDDDRTPEGKDRWTTERYKDKLAKIARVISEVGAEVTGNSPDIIGLCEIENYEVLYDLTTQTILADKNYGIVHFDSPDERGVDVALLYKKNVFLPTHFKNYPLYLYDDDGSRDYTRDQLLVSGLLDGEEMHFIVNHWPSRVGGEARSRPRREAAALLNKKIITSLREINPKAKILSMGDLNDDPTSSSLKEVLKTEGKKNEVKEDGLYNPMEEMAKKGYGSLAHRDSWNLFDQLFFTATLLHNDGATYGYWKAGIFNKRYLITDSGKYKGYPFRSYDNNNYTGGYSDHFPVYVYLIKEVD